MQTLKESFSKISFSAIRWLWLIGALGLYWLTCCQSNGFGSQLASIVSVLLLMITFVLLKDQNWLASITVILLFLMQLPHMFPLGRQWLTTIVPWLALLIFIAIPLCRYRHDWEDGEITELNMKQFSMTIGIVMFEILISFYILIPFLGNVSFLSGLMHTNMTMAFMQHTFVILAEAWSWIAGSYLLFSKAREGWLFMMIPQIGSLILNDGHIFTSQLSAFVILLICICAYLDPQWKK